MTSRFAVALLCLLGVALGSVSTRGESWAVVVGVSQYEDPSIADLRYASTDARAMALALEDDCGLDRSHIWLLTDEEATRSEIESAFRALASQTRVGDVVYAYFAGHGTNTLDRDGDEADGDNLDEAFLPYDALLLDPSTYLLDDTLGEWIAKLEASSAVLFLDSCYSGGQSRDAGMIPMGIAAEDSIARDVLTSGLGGPLRGVLAACEPRQLAYENPTLGHGVFTHYLLQGLTSDVTDVDGDSVVTLNELAAYVIREVGLWSAGRPEEQTPVLEAPTSGGISIISDLRARHLDAHHLAYQLSFDAGAGGADPQSPEVVNRGGEWVDGIVGLAMHFDNLPMHNTFLRTSTSYEPREGPFAVSLWFRTETPVGHLFSTHSRQNTYGPNYTVLFSPDGSVTFRTNDAAVNHRQDLTTTVFRWDDGQWHHLLVQRLPSGRKEIWIDGTLEAAETYAIQDIRNGGNPLTVGADAYNGWSPGRSYSGDIDDFRIYDCALDPGQIGDLLALGVPDAPVAFADPLVEQAVRAALGNPGGVLISQQLLQVRTLELDAGRTIDLSGIEGCRNIRELGMAHAGIVDVGILRAFPGLIRLDLPNNRIVDIAPLAALHSVELLDLSGNFVSDLSALAAMHSLYDLDLSGNLIESLAPLGGLTSMKLLFLAENRISDLSPLGALEKLWYLDLRGNAVSDLAPLTGLYGLRALYLGENELADVSPIGELLGLEELDLSGNRIADVSALCELEWLGDYTKFEPGREATTLDLSDNAIADPLPLAGSLGLGAGDVLDLRGNSLDGISAEERKAFVEGFGERGVTVLID